MSLNHGTCDRDWSIEYHTVQATLFIKLHKANLTTIREGFNIRLFIMVFCYKYYFFKNYFQFTGSSILGQQNMSGEKGYLMSCENFYMFYDATVVASVA